VYKTTGINTAVDKVSAHVTIAKITSPVIYRENNLSRRINHTLLSSDLLRNDPVTSRHVPRIDFLYFFHHGSRESGFVMISIISGWPALLI
jgi:hypothetical protein